MPTAEFDLPATHQDVVAVPPTEFPLDGAPEDAVLSEVSARLEGNRYQRDRNFAITYSGTPHPISRRVEALAEGTFFVEWADESETGTLSMEREAVRDGRLAARRSGRGRVHHERRHGVQPRRAAADAQQRPTIRARGRRPDDDALQLPSRRRAHGDPPGRDRRRRRDVPAPDRGRRAGDRPATPSAWSAPRPRAASACSIRSRPSPTWRCERDSISTSTRRSADSSCRSCATSATRSRRSTCRCRA